MATSGPGQLRHRVGSLGEEPGSDTGGAAESAVMGDERSFSTSSFLTNWVSVVAFP